jgi:hypothetical protein
MTENQRAKSREIRDSLVSIRAKLDHLNKQAEADDVQITVETVNALVTEKATLDDYAVEARVNGKQTCWPK